MKIYEKDGETVLDISEEVNELHDPKRRAAVKLKSALAEVRKHLPGEHDQDAHAGDDPKMSQEEKEKLEAKKQKLKEEKEKQAQKEAWKLLDEHKEPPSQKPTGKFSWMHAKPGELGPQGSAPKQQTFQFGVTDPSNPKKMSWVPASSGEYKKKPKPSIEPLPNVGMAFFKKDPKYSVQKDMTINGIPFNEKVESEYWLQDKTKPFPNEPLKIKDAVEEYEYIDQLTGETKKKTGWKKKSSGAIVMEPDGRIWLLEPNNHYGGYNATYPKGRIEPMLTPHQNAKKEIFEELGLTVELTDFLADVEGDTTVTRYYLAQRTGGSPYLMGKEAYSARLVNFEEADQMLNRNRDKNILKLLRAKFPMHKAATSPTISNRFLPTGDVPVSSGMGYHIWDDEEEPDTSIVAELIPLSIGRSGYANIARHQFHYIPVTGDSPTQEATAAAKKLYGTDKVFNVAWRTHDEKDDVEMVTYAVLIEKPLEELEGEAYAITVVDDPLGARSHDNNAVALFAVQALAEDVYDHPDVAKFVGPKWVAALRPHMPFGGRQEYNP